MLQRLRCWVENLGFLFVLAIFAVVAILEQLAISNQQLANPDLAGVLAYSPVVSCSLPPFS